MHSQSHPPAPPAAAMLRRDNQDTLTSQSTPSTTSSAIHTGPKAVYIVMHHIETLSTPAPLTFDNFSTLGNRTSSEPEHYLNVSKSIYAYTTKERAEDHAERYAQKRRELLGLYTIGVYNELKWECTTKREMHDHDGAYIGTGWHLVKKQKQRVVDGGGEKMVQRELVWVAEQWMDERL